MAGVIDTTVGHFHRALDLCDLEVIRSPPDAIVGIQVGVNIFVFRLDLSENIKSIKRFLIAVALQNYNVCHRQHFCSCLVT